MEKTIPREILAVISELLVSDLYTRALGRRGEFGIHPETESGPGSEVFFERFIHMLFPDFFTSSPFDPTLPPIIRRGEVPLEAHFESGSQASFVKYPGIIKEALNSEESRLDIPDGIVSFPITEIAYAYINDINLKPADALGTVDLQWHSATESLMLTIAFETADEEIRGEYVFFGIALSYDFNEILARVFLKPRISRGRMLWDWGVMSRVSEGSDVETRYAAITSEFKSAIARSFPRPGDAGDNRGARTLASGLVNALRSLFAANAELIGNAFMTLPLRPQPLRKESLDSFLAAILGFAHIPIPVDRLGEKQKLLLGIITGYFTDPVESIALTSALGMQNLLSIFPFGGRSTINLLDPSNPLQHTLESMRDGLRAAWRAEIGRELSPDEEDHVNTSMLPRELEKFLTDHVEVSHLVDRRATYESFGIEEPDCRIVYSDIPLEPPVPCMRYKVSLDVLELVSDPIEAFERELFSIVDGLPLYIPPRLAVQWEVYSFHGAFRDPLREEDWVRDGGVFAGAQLLTRNTQFIPFRGARNGTDDLLSRELYLEWSTAVRDTNAKLLIVGKIFSTLGLNSGEEFQIVVPMTPAIGLFTDHSGTVRSEEVDNVVTFKTEVRGDRLRNFRYDWRIFARLVQTPSAGNTESISVAIKDLSIFKPRVSIPRVQLEAKLNGVTFQTSEIITVPSPFPGRFFSRLLDAGWSQNIVFDRTSVAESFELEIILHILADGSFSAERHIIISRTFYRFSNGRGEQVRAEDGALETAVDVAVGAGAVFEWGIPIGLTVDNVRLQDAETDPQVAVTVEITKKNLTRTPPEFAPKNLKIEYPKVLFTVATSGSGADEVRFFPRVERTERIDGRSLEPKWVRQQRTRRFDAYAGREIILPGPPGWLVECHPGRSSLRIACRGKEYDPPFSTDNLGTASVGFDVPVDSSVDGIYSNESHGPDGSFEMFALVTTASAPTPPRLTFQAMPEGIDFLASTSGSPVTLEYAAGWADHLFLLGREDGASEFSLVADLRLALSGITPPVTPAVTTFYKIRSIAGTFSADSREIQVFI